MSKPWKISINLYLQTPSQFYAHFHRISQISTIFWAPQYIPKSAAPLVGGWRVRPIAKLIVLQCFKPLNWYVCSYLLWGQNLEKNVPGRSSSEVLGLSIFDVFSTSIPEVVWRHFGAPQPPKIQPKSPWNSIFAVPFFRTFFERFWMFFERFRTFFGRFSDVFGRFRTFSDVFRAFSDVCRGFNG